MAATEADITALRQHAEDRLKAHGTNAILKVRATLCRDLTISLSGVTSAAAQAAAPPTDQEHSSVIEMREARDAAASAQSAAEKEIGLMRSVVEAGEGGKKKEVNAAIKAYRSEYPAAAGNTADRAPDGDDDQGTEDDQGGGE